MADEKYSIDDILNEVGTSRGNNKGVKRRSADESVTEIIDGGDEIDRLIKAGRQNKNRKPDISVTEVIDSIAVKNAAKNGVQRPPVKSAKQRTDEEVARRLAADISRAADNKPPVSLDEDDDVVEYAARQRTESEVRERIAKDISNAADVKRYHELTRRDVSNLEEEDDVTPYNPQSSGDDIVLHDASTFVPSDTMEMRRAKKLNEFQINSELEAEARDEDELFTSINPMDAPDKTSELPVISKEDETKKISKSQSYEETPEDTDTLAVSGNELKALGREEHIKEYTPSVSRRREEPAEETPARQTPFTGELHVGETIIDALNKKISDDAAAPVIDVPISGKNGAEAYSEADENEQLEKIKQVNELAQKKRRKISEFILDGRDDTAENDPVSDDELFEELDDEDEETPVDLNDENVIRDRLTRASKGLWGRLIILGVLLLGTLFLEAVSIFRWNIGRLATMISFRYAPDTYLYINIGVAILSFTVCSSVVSNGFMRLIKLRPDGDTLCALAHTGAIAALLPYLFGKTYTQLGFSHIFLAVSLGAIICNTVSKLLTVKTAQNNFAFIFGRDNKYFIDRPEGGGAEQLAKGAVEGLPAIASIRKTEMLCDFIVSTYCEDSSDRTSRKITPIALGAALVGGVIAFFNCKSSLPGSAASWAATVASAILAVSAAFSSSMTVTLPMYLASRKAKTRGTAILGYTAAEDMSETNAVLVNAKMLFPAETVKIVNICGYDTPKTRGEGKINIDEAIIYAASLAVASDSVMADALFHILNYKKELLKSVSGCVYENSLGVMGWIDRRRVLLGTRAHMKAHEITVPNTKKEAAANKDNDEVIYLAVGGEVCLLFFVKPTANPVVRRSVRELAFRNISLVVKTVDGMMTAPIIAKVFGIDEERVKVLPYELHGTFDENTKFVSSASAAISSDGSFASLSNAVTASRAIRDRANLGNILQFVGVALACVAAIVFTLACSEDTLRKFNMFNTFFILLYSTVWGALTLGAQFFRRT